MQNPIPASYLAKKKESCSHSDFVLIPPATSL